MKYKTKAISRNGKQIVANENVSQNEGETAKDEQTFLKPIHKRTASLPYEQRG